MSNFSGWQSSANFSIYPFKEGSSLKALSGWQLPAGAILDAHVLGLLAGEPRLESLSRSGSGVVGTIEAAGQPLGAFTVEPEGGACPIVFEGAHRGTILCAPNIQWRMIESTEIFEPETSIFEGTACFRQPSPSVSSLSINGLAERGGRIFLVEGEGVQLVAAEGTSDQFRVDLIGEPDLSQQNCPPVGTPLLKINDMVANSSGNVNLLVAQYSAPATETSLRQLLRITPTSNGLRFSLAP